MSQWAYRTIFVAAFVIACVLFRLGYRRIRRVERPESSGGAFRLAFYLAVALLAGCSSGRRGWETTAAGGDDAVTAAAGASRGPVSTAQGAATTDLGPDFDAVWRDLMALWHEAAGFEPGVVTGDQLADSRGRLDGLLARLGGIDRVVADAPGLVALLRIEFLDALEVMPADVLCREPAPPRTDGALAFDRIAARVDAVEELAASGYLNDWLRAQVVDRLRADVATVRSAIGEGDSWRTEDYVLRSRDPRELEPIVARMEAALEHLAGR